MATTIWHVTIHDDYNGYTEILVPGATEQEARAAAIEHMKVWFNEPVEQTMPVISTNEHGQTIVTLRGPIRNEEFTAEIELSSLEPTATVNITMPTGREQAFTLTLNDDGTLIGIPTTEE